MAIEIDGIDMGESIFDVFEAVALKKLDQAERKQEAQRQDQAVERDAAKIAGYLTDELYRLVNECV